MKNKTRMQLGRTVTFKYGNSTVIGKLTDKKGNTYLVDVATINGIKQEHKTVVTVTTNTVLNYLLNK